MLIFQRPEGLRAQLTTPHEVLDCPILIFGLSDVDMIDLVAETNEVFLLDTDLLKVIQNEVQSCSLVTESYPLHNFLGTEKSLVFESKLKSCEDQKIELFELQELFFGDILMMPESENPVMTDDDYLVDYLHSVPSFELSKLNKKVMEKRAKELQKAKIILLKGTITDVEKVGVVDVDKSFALFFQPTDQYLNYYPRFADMNFDGFIFPNFGRLCRDGFVLVTDPKNAELPLYNLNDSQYSMDTTPLSESCECEICKKRSKIFIAKILKICPAKGANFLMIHNIFQIKNLFKKNSIKNENF